MSLDRPSTQFAFDWRKSKVAVSIQPGNYPNHEIAKWAATVEKENRNV